MEPNHKTNIGTCFLARNCFAAVQDYYCYATFACSAKDLARLKKRTTINISEF